MIGGVAKEDDRANGARSTVLARMGPYTPIRSHLARSPGSSAGPDAPRPGTERALLGKLVASLSLVPYDRFFNSCALFVRGEKNGVFKVTRD